MATFDLRRFPGPEALAETAARDLLKEISAANAKSQPFSTALSGGRIAKTFFSTLAAQARAQAVSLTGVHFFWSDERCVPPSEPESNYRAPDELLFAPLAIPASQIHRVEGEKPPAEAALTAEAELRRVVPCRPDEQPVLDLVLLGMGEDGHVASLFPGEPEVVMTSRAVYRRVTAVKPPPQRITLGYPAIAAARQVWVLISGPGKENALRESLDAQGRTPLARVLGLRSFSRLYCDCKV
jgi:6-phosphogluconolactonase